MTENQEHPLRLIHWPIDQLKPTGGQSGYLYNLNLGFERDGIEGYEFLPPEGTTVGTFAPMKKYLPKRLVELRRLKNTLNIPNLHETSPVDFSKYEAVHFHWTKQCYSHRDELEDYQGKVVLTSHTPCACFREFISKLNPKDAEAHAEELKGLSIIDEYSFSRADYVIFPCQEAEEPYFHTWEGYADVRDERKLRYVPTGIAPVTAKVGRAEIRARYGIPEDAFVVCYVGRHNQIKGYDLLQQVAPELLADKDVWFLVAGNEGPIYSLKDPRWVEVGWTNDPHSIISAADVFVLPNRETFFDLIMLEVLSLGQVVVASRTGGNKFFEKFGCEGIRLYDTPDEMVDAIQAVHAADEGRRKAWRAASKALYEQEFTVDVFARRYDAVMQEICSK